MVRLPDKLDYNAGEPISLSGMTVNVFHVGGNGRELVHGYDEAASHPERYEVKGYDSSVSGEQNVKLVYRSYNEAVGEWVYAEAGFTVRVRAASTTTTTTTTSTETTTTTTSPVTGPPDPHEGIILGDVNMDGDVNSVDASQILAEYARIATNGEPAFNEKQNIAGDVDENGDINSVDASKVLAFYAYTASGGTITDMREWLKK